MYPIIETAKLSETKIREMIKDHQHYISKDVDGWESMRANFSDVEFPDGFDFNRADLRGVNFSRATLYSADFSYCRLDHANFHDALIENSNFYMAYLYHAILTDVAGDGSNFACANLASADLSFSSFMYAIFSNSTLTNATMFNTDLYSADMTSASLSQAQIKPDRMDGSSWIGCDASFAREIPDTGSFCPEVGSFIGFKKVRENCILTLKIPEDARRVSAIGSRACRCDKAMVIGVEAVNGITIYDPDGNLVLHSIYDPNFRYKLGEMAVEPKYNDDPRKEFTSGIHFFISKKEALRFDPYKTQIKL